MILVGKPHVKRKHLGSLLSWDHNNRLQLMNKLSLSRYLIDALYKRFHVLVLSLKIECLKYV
jgi:hypothetical protein